MLAWEPMGHIEKLFMGASFEKHFYGRPPLRSFFKGAYLDKLFMGAPLKKHF